MITGGRIPSIKEMKADENEWRSMEKIKMSFKMWEKKGLVPIGKAIEHTSIYGTDLSDDENAESILKMFVGLPAEVITQGV
jgi:hypothetical protein